MRFQVYKFVVFVGGCFWYRYLVWNHLDIPLLAKYVPRVGSHSIDYGELLGIIESYLVGMALSVRFLIESDSLFCYLKP